jgi:hypothetical protein
LVLDVIVADAAAVVALGAATGAATRAVTFCGVDDDGCCPEVVALVTEEVLAALIGVLPLLAGATTAAVAGVLTVFEDLSALFLRLLPLELGAACSLRFSVDDAAELCFVGCCSEPTYPTASGTLIPVERLEPLGVADSNCAFS